MTKILTLLFVFFLISGCSYEPVLLNNEYNFQFSNISSEGNNKINKIIKNNLLQKSNGNKKYDIYFSTTNDKEIISSDTKGDPTILKQKIYLNFILSENGNEITRNSIYKEATYNNITDKFELLKYEENILKSLSNNISSEIIMIITSLNK